MIQARQRMADFPTADGPIFDGNCQWRRRGADAKPRIGLIFRTRPCRLFRHGAVVNLPLKSVQAELRQFTNWRIYQS
jgi:hypothetical protein